MEMEGAGEGLAPSRGHEIGQLVALSGLTIFASLFGLMAIMSIAETVGPSETRSGRVLARSSLEWTGNSCSVLPNRRRDRSQDRCVEFVTPAGAVTGEFPDGETWVVVANDSVTSPSDVAGPPGSEIEVTTSNLTGRVTALDNGSRFESRWARSGSLEFFVVLGAGTFLAVALAALFVLRRHKGQSFDQLPRPAVIGAFAAAIGIGAFGAWWGAIRSYDQYRTPSSADRYGALVADPYVFASTAGEAEDTGRAVEIPSEGMMIRALSEAEIAADVRDLIDAEPRPIVALIAEGTRATSRFVVIRVLADDGAGVVVEAEPCGGFEFPVEIGVDPGVRAGLFCLPADVDTTATISVAEGRNALGVPIAAPLLG